MSSFKKKMQKSMVVVLKIILFLPLSLLADFHSVFRGFKTNKRAELVETIRWWGRSGIGRSTVLIDDNYIDFLFLFSSFLSFFLFYLPFSVLLSAFNNFLWSSLTHCLPPSFSTPFFNIFFNTFLLSYVLSSTPLLFLFLFLLLLSQDEYTVEESGSKEQQQAVDHTAKKAVDRARFELKMLLEQPLSGPKSAPNRKKGFVVFAR